MRLRAGLACACLAASLSARADCDKPEHHALDFWLGAWVVRDGGKPVAVSHIQRGPGGCVVIERYEQNDGYSGTSVSFYDAALGRWRQTWVDSTGAVGEFTGEPSEGAMQFAGETHRPDGTRIQRRMRLAADGEGVRQTSLASRDGREWKPHYVLTYARERPPLDRLPKPGDGR
jgi:hypothetical protein